MSELLLGYFAVFGLALLGWVSFAIYSYKKSLKGKITKIE